MASAVEILKNGVQLLVINEHFKLNLFFLTANHFFQTKVV